ncbi:MAG TPA: hypothetical protein VHO67_15250 [Polyangia bacterium]|nr:hypothetical protein [Polyangia bacterium]
MTRPAALVLLAALGAAGCRVNLTFDPPDAARVSDAGRAGDAAHGPDAGDAARGCATDHDCPLSTLHCDPLSGQCLACVLDGDCGSASRPVCDAALHICVQCGADQDCGGGAAGWRCVKTTRSCVRTCASGADCAPAGNWCDEGVCAQCDDDHECTGARAHCDTATRQCAGCVADAQCTTAAAPHCDRTSGQCVGCLTTADCASGVCDPSTWTCKTPAP